MKREVFECGGIFTWCRLAEVIFQNTVCTSSSHSCDLWTRNTHTHTHSFFVKIFGHHLSVKTWLSCSYFPTVSTALAKFLLLNVCIDKANFSRLYSYALVFMKLQADSAFCHYCFPPYLEPAVQSKLVVSIELSRNKWRTCWCPSLLLVVNVSQ